MTADPGELLSLAVAAATAAGRLLVDERPRDLGVGTKSTPTDVVTVMDRRAERLLVERLQAARPDDGFLGEEGTQAVGGSGVRWVLDPIDGTVNYLYDLPGWAVSVAAEVDGEVAVGVVHVPTYGETFAAVRGGGATRNGVPVHVSTCEQLSQALVATGFGYAAARRARQARVLAEVLPRVRDVRRFGAASVDLCAVACGRVDGYYERGLKPWDLAAGGLVAQEAGALVAGLRGAPASEELVLAASRTLFPALHDLLDPLAPDRD
ncbi:MAG: inositol monophosphatase [Actinomycetia bacterium]|jgi:myo-inositol-1(or 4)-monophosphatase|nr:inositol monophosphatase [Actinomycetes bacterium]